MLLVQRVVSFLFSVFILFAGYKFQKGVPTVGATGEAVNIGGNFYPTSLVLWFFWIITIGIAGIYFLYALRPIGKVKK
jgi:hypothetical protein